MPQSTKPSDLAFSFEAVFIGATKDAKGFVVKLAIHPNDVPEAFVKDLIGSRYQVGACRVDDQGQPVGKKKDVGSAEVQRAAQVCQNPDFQIFMKERHGAFDASEKEARDTLCTYCGIESRSELKTSRQAVFRFEVLMKEYTNYEPA